LKAESLLAKVVFSKQAFSKVLPSNPQQKLSRR